VIGLLLGSLVVLVVPPPPAPGPAPLPPPVAEPGEVVVTPVPLPPTPRPRITVAVGMGATFDSSGFASGKTHAIPEFVATGGFGDGRVGFDISVFSSSASGRYRNDAPVDRLSLDGFAVFRPLARELPADTVHYPSRVLRTVAVELGAGVERDSQVVRAASRGGIHTGARVELPLEPAGRASEVRLRVGLRDFIGLHTPQVGDTSVGDTFELYGALVASF
jgi:hypothetical protein